VRRGDLVTVAVSGDYGKPRPAPIVQADVYAEHPSVTVLPLTSELIDAPLLRVTVEPGASTGLRLRSQVMEGDDDTARQDGPPDRPTGAGNAEPREPGSGCLPRSGMKAGGRKAVATRPRPEMTTILLPCPSSSPILPIRGCDEDSNRL
jgi:mRNA interferase MazF